MPADLLVHFNTDYDDIVVPLTPTTTNGTYISIDTVTKKFGAGSVYFNPPNSSTDVKLTYAPDAVFNWSGAFTIDCQVKWEAGNFSSTYKTIWSNGDWATTGIALMQVNADGRFFLVYDGNFQNVGTTNTHDGNFHHVAVTRSGSSIRLFVDGIEEGTTGSSATSFTGGSFYLSYSPFQPNTSYFPWTGWVDELRILSSTAEWTSNFTAPVSEYSLATTVSEDIFSDTDIQGTTEQDIFSDAQVVLTTSDNILSDARISPIKFIFSDTDIQGTTEQDIFSDAQVVLTTSDNILSDTTVYITLNETILSDAQVITVSNQILTSQTIILTPLDLQCELLYTNTLDTYKQFEVEVIQATPGVPFSVVITNVGNGDNLRIEWSGTAPFYNVYRVDTGPVYTKVNPFLISDHFYVVGGLQENTPYTFVVRGADGQG